MTYVYLLKSVSGPLIGVFSSGLSATQFASDHRMFEGFYIEQTRVNEPLVLLKDGTY